MARSDLEILAEIKLSNRREFDKQLRSLEKRKVFIDTKRSEQALGRITGKANEFTKSLEASNLQRTLEKGFTIVRNQKGKIIKDGGGLAKNDKVLTTFRDGEREMSVE